MGHNCRNELSVICQCEETNSLCKVVREKCPNNFKKRLAKVNKIINNLECSMLQSNEDDRQLLMITQRDNLKNQKLEYQLEEARNENKLLLSNLNISKSRIQSDFSSSYSTISMVHLQYKYEELSSSYEGLLKVLDSKEKECKNCYRENEELRDEIQKLRLQIAGNENVIKTLCDKYMRLKERKDAKVSSLKFEKDTLKLVHDQLVNLLNGR